MIEELRSSEQPNINTNNLYGITLFTLVKDMKRNLANQRIKECVTALLDMGYSKKELTDYINLFLKGE